MGNSIGRSSAASVDKDSFVDVLFFPDRAMPCKHFRTPRGCTRKNCKYLHDEDSSLLQFLSYLDGAKRTMDICVFTITCDEIANAVLAAHKRGVRVRVITDDTQATSLGSDIQKFVDAGIPVRDDNAPTHMHHKFCILDKRTLLNGTEAPGSFNWSRQAVLGNVENLVVSVGGPIIDRFGEYFEKLWAQYKR